MMDNEKWPAFITGFVLGILVAGGVLGSFGWRKLQQARAEAEARAARTEEAVLRARQEAEELRRQAELAAEQERKARKALDEALSNIKLKAGQPGDKKDR